MSIYDNGTQYPWEIWVGLIIAGVVLYLVVRASRKSDRRHAVRMSQAPGGPATRAGATKRPPQKGA